MNLRDMICIGLWQRFQPAARRRSSRSFSVGAWRCEIVDVADSLNAGVLQDRTSVLVGQIVWGSSIANQYGGIHTIFRQHGWAVPCQRGSVDYDQFEVSAKSIDQSA